MAKLYYDDAADLVAHSGKKGSDHRLRLARPRARSEPARQRRATSASACSRGSASRAKAEKDGLTVNTPAEAAAWADVIMILAPDTKQPKLYQRSHRAQSESPARRLMFAHGFNIRFGTIKPPASRRCLDGRPQSSRPSRTRSFHRRRRHSGVTCRRARRQRPRQSTRALLRKRPRHHSRRRSGNHLHRRNRNRSLRRTGRPVRRRQRTDQSRL